MPEFASLSHTAELEIGLFAGQLPHDTQGFAELPSSRTSSIQVAMVGDIETLASVPRARVFDVSEDARSIQVESWLGSALERLDEIASAAPNWDGYGAPAVNAVAAISALKFLKQVATSGVAPAIVATGSGNVQIEWRSGTYGLDVEIGPDSTYYATLFNGRKDLDEWTGDLRQGVHPELALAIGSISWGLQLVS